MTDNNIIEHLKNKQYHKAEQGLYIVLPAIRKHIIQQGGTAEDAKDMYQDALVILFRKVQAGTLQLTVPLTTYLFAIAKNLWRMELRRKNKLPMADSTDDIAEVLTDEEPAFTQAQTAFGMLGEKCRDLLVLFYFKQLSFKTIAATLGFSDEKVAKNQKYRCLEKAKAHFLTLSNSSNHGE